MSLQREVEATLARGFRWLRFSQRLEERYESDTRKARCKAHLAIGLVALVIYDLFLITDLTMIPDVFDTAVVVRFLIVTPIGLAVAWTISRDPVPAIREAVTVAMAPIIVGSILYLMLISASPMRQYQHTGVILVMLFPIIAQAVHFRFAVLGLLICFGLYVAAVLAVPEIPPPVKQSAIMVQLGAVLFMIIASYRIERHTRLSYLVGLRDLLRNEELDTMSKTDPLTGLWNRRAMDEALEAMWLAAERDPAPVSILVLDIDHFKSFNDRYGHLDGDRCIREIARIASAQLWSSSDVAVRFGGEELVFVLPGTDLREATIVADQMRSAVERAAITHEASGQFGIVTVSIGVASTVPSEFVDPKELILGADTALYVAKRSGRNQVSPPPPGPQTPDLVVETAAA